MAVKCDILCYIQQRLTNENRDAIVRSITTEANGTQVDDALSVLSGFLGDKMPDVDDQDRPGSILGIYMDGISNGVVFPEYTTSNLDFVNRISNVYHTEQQKDANAFIFRQIREMGDAIQQLKEENEVHVRMEKKADKQITDLQGAVRDLRRANGDSRQAVVPRQHPPVLGPNGRPPRPPTPVPSVQVEDYGSNDPITTVHSGNQRRDLQTTYSGVAQRSRETPVFTNPQMQNNQSGETGDGEGWILAGGTKRRQRGPVTVGNSGDGAISGVQPRAQLFVFRVSKGTGAEKVASYMRGKGITVHECEMVSVKEHHFESYYICINGDQQESVLNASFWPQYVSCRTWAGRRPNSTRPGGTFAG